MDPLVHLITPGDHFSPSTGSAVPTVVHGLSAATPAGEPRPAVLVARGTYPDRYPSADAVEYDDAPLAGLTGRAAGLFAGSTVGRVADVALGRLTGARPGAGHRLRSPLSALGERPASYLVAHNLPQAAGLVPGPHRGVLWAHNELLRTYSRREAGRALDRVAAIVCVSDYIADRTADRLPPRLRDRVAVVRNGVDTAQFRPGPARRDGAPLHVVFVGRMLHDKGPDVLVDALVRLGRADVTATIMGAAGFAPGSEVSPYEAGLRTAAAPLGDRIRWEPFRPRHEVAAALATADVAVVPSRWPDPCPLTVLEGMASGAAVVASRTGGIPEQVGDAGILVPPGDAGALAEVIGALADDRAELARVRERSRAHAEASSWAARWPAVRAALA